MMNDGEQSKRGRRKKPCGDDVDLHIRVDRALFEKAHRPNCSTSATVERGLRAVILGCSSNDIGCLGFLMREERRQVAFHTQNIIRLREQAKKLGCDDLDALVEGIESW